MTPLGTWLSKFVPPKVWVVLGILKKLLNAGSTATGAYSQSDSPNLPQPLLGGLKGSLVKHEVQGILEKAANPTLEAGMSHTQAAILSALAAIFAAAIQGLDFSLLFSHPKAFASSLFTALVVAWAAYLKEPNRAKVDLGSNRRVAEAQAEEPKE